MRLQASCFLAIATSLAAAQISGAAENAGVPKGFKMTKVKLGEDRPGVIKLGEDNPNVIKLGGENEKVIKIGGYSTEKVKKIGSGLDLKAMHDAAFSTAAKPATENAADKPSGTAQLLAEAGVGKDKQAPAQDQKAAEQKAAEQKAAEQKAAEQKAAEQKAAVANVAPVVPVKPMPQPNASQQPQPANPGAAAQAKGTNASPTNAVSKVEAKAGKP